MSFSKSECQEFFRTGINPKTGLCVDTNTRNEIELECSKLSMDGIDCDRIYKLHKLCKLLKLFKRII